MTLKKTAEAQGDDSSSNEGQNTCAGFRKWRGRPLLLPDELVGAALLEELVMLTEPLDREPLAPELVGAELPEVVIEDDGAAVEAPPT